MTLADYEFDLFISYSRRGSVAEWVKNHLEDVLVKTVTDELGYEPTYFLDVRMETGTAWPDAIERALARSRVLVAVLSVPYFHSRWCLSEWETMRAREDALGLATPAAPGGLIFPLRFADGERFPADALRRNHRFVKQWSYPYRQFAESREYLHFYDSMKEFAAELVPRIEEAPVWNTGWPTVRRDDSPPRPTARRPVL